MYVVQYTNTLFQEKLTILSYNKKDIKISLYRQL